MTSHELLLWIGQYTAPVWLYVVILSPDPPPQHDPIRDK